MGCNNSKAKEGRSATDAAGSKDGAFPTTVKDQAAAFERELTGERKVMERDDPEPQSANHSGDGAANTRAVTRTLPLNPLAVELARQYRRRRDALLEERAREAGAVSTQQLQERQEKRERVLGDRAPAVDGGHLASGGVDSNDAEGDVPPTQEAFTVLANERAADAVAVGFDPDKVAKTMKLFPAWVARDVYTVNRHLTTEVPGTRGNTKAISSPQRTTDGNQAWDCEVKLELRGADSAADVALQQAVKALDARIEREAAERKRAPQPSPPTEQTAEVTTRKKQKQTGRDAPKEAGTNDPPPSTVSTGSGVLFINAVFVFQVDGSYDRKQPWQMEVCFFFQHAS